jgi:GT2 family glycosyltransferase
MKSFINASIVLYNSNTTEVQEVIDSFLSSKQSNIIYLIDNSPTDCLKYCFKGERIRYFFTGKNLGYGAAHNIALKKSIESGCEYHVVLNPDLIFDPNVIDELYDYMINNSEIGQIMPRIIYPDGELQKLCKLVPSPLDLFFRRFLPKKISAKNDYHYTLSFTGYDKIMEVPYLSGCFMFLRVEIVNKIGLFDERFFMYPEDIDLTRRMNKISSTIFYPKVTVIHNHAKESYASIKMLWIHITNMIKYFNKWGWLFDSDRKRTNKRILSQLGKNV